MVGEVHVVYFETFRIDQVSHDQYSYRDLVDRAGKNFAGQGCN